MGGGTAGLKFISAEKGLYPKYQISPLQLSPKHIEEYNNKLLVVYTGKTRMAKPILWNIVDNWFMRRESTKVQHSSDFNG